MNAQKVSTLSDLNTRIAKAKQKLYSVLPADSEGLARARDELRSSKEALRIFAFKAKPCLTRSGRCLRP